MRKHLKVLLITQGVSRVVSPLFLSGHDVVGVLESMPRDFQLRREKAWLYDLLRGVYSVFIKKEDSLKQWCERRRVPYNFIWKGNSPEMIGWIASLKPELIVIFSMSQLLNEDILRLPSLGVINLHPSYLPAYRGANPDFWQYYDMEMEPGVTVHYVDKREDSGDIIFQERLSMPLGTKSPEWLDRLIGGAGVSLVLRALDAIAKGDVPRTAQPAISPTLRARNLRADEHSKIIDWDNWPVERIWHVLRGTESWLNAIPQPTGFLSGQRWSIGVFERRADIKGVPGTIIQRNGKRCVVARDGVIYLSMTFNWKRMILRLVSHKS